MSGSLRDPVDLNLAICRAVNARPWSGSLRDPLDLNQ